MARIHGRGEAAKDALLFCDNVQPFHLLEDDKVQYAIVQNLAIWQVRQTNRIRTEVPGQL